MPQLPHRTQPRPAPGSSKQELEEEPDWSSRYQNRIGLKHRDGYVIGVTHAGDEAESDDDDDDEFEQKARQELQDLQRHERRGDLVNIRDVIQNQEDYHLRQPKDFPRTWRYVVQNTEDWIKNTEDWPINIQKREKQKQKQKQKQTSGKASQQKDSQGGQAKRSQTDDHQRSSANGHRGTSAGSRQDSSTSADQAPSFDGHQNGARQGSNDAASPGQEGSSPDTQRGTSRDARQGLSPDTSQMQRDGDDNPSKDGPNEDQDNDLSSQARALLRVVRQEKEDMCNLQTNDGHNASPAIKMSSPVSIDEADQFSPDNWIPRSTKLIRLTGKHPLNAEPKLSALFNAGLITPNGLHYVRNHGAVPHLLWETHQLEVEGRALVLGMDDLKSKFDCINIPVALACDGNRRKELNMIRRSKGFNWGPGAVSCAYWKGVLVRDILFAAGIPAKYPDRDTQGLWVNFEGADEPSEGKYSTCVPLQYALDPANDVLVAYEMNDELLPPDHGYPLRLIVPGFVGGRCVKWLQKIWISDRENDSHYHIWDNRVLPSIVDDNEGELARTMFEHPDTKCNEQNLNSVVVRPAQGERIALSGVKKGDAYCVQGYAYDGGGHEVQRVEISLDGGDTWTYCARRFPEQPVRHGFKYWTWVHWQVEVEITQLLQCSALAVRCFNVFKNTQPERPSWNLLGMMNNCWYVVKPEIVSSATDDGPELLFRHPVEPGTGDGGWLQPSSEVRIADAKQSAGTPSKQYTRAEIEQHDREDDCWLVIDGRVYDVSSVLAWHPGGKSAILGHAGKVHQETSEEFASVHDDYAYQKLGECVIGSVTNKAKMFIKRNAEAAAKERAQSDAGSTNNAALEKHRWNPATLRAREQLSADSRKYTFALPDGKTALGLGTCQHIQIGFHFADRMVIRSYTPTRPIVQSDEDGTFELVVKTYLPSDQQPGGTLSNVLDCIDVGEQVEIKGPTGDVIYHGQGRFSIEGQKRRFTRVSLILGGSGITPGFALLARILQTDDDATQLRILDANKTENDILLRDEMDRLRARRPDQCQITHVLSHPSEHWDGLHGHVNADMIRQNLFPPAQDAVVFLCGPPAMIQKSALPALRDWGYSEEENCFGF